MFVVSAANFQLANFCIYLGHIDKLANTTDELITQQILNPSKICKYLSELYHYLVEIS